MLLLLQFLLQRSTAPLNQLYVAELNTEQVRSFHIRVSCTDRPHLAWELDVQHLFNKSYFSTSCGQHTIDSTSDTMNFLKFLNN